MTTSTRTRCERCTLLVQQCVCAHRVLIDNATPVRILQHPDEASHPLNTARWVSLGLTRTQIISREHYTPEDWEVAACTSVLLYPNGPGEPALAPLPQQRYALVVLDGTWRQAAAMLRNNAALRALPRIGLSASTPSAYRLRKSPRADGLSTVEAVAAALDILDAPTCHQDLMRPFHAHIDRQIAEQRAHMGDMAFAKNYPHLGDPD